MVASTSINYEVNNIQLSVTHSVSVRNLQQTENLELSF